jgi:hypothetical protein
LKFILRRIILVAELLLLALWITCEQRAGFSVPAAGSFFEKETQLFESIDNLSF